MKENVFAGDVGVFFHTFLGSVQAFGCQESHGRKGPNLTNFLSCQFKVGLKQSQVTL